MCDSKECSKCAVTKPLTAYYVVNDLRNPNNPHQRRWAHCIECHLAHVEAPSRRPHRQANARALSAKKRAQGREPPAGNKQCSTCKETKPTSSFKWRKERQAYASKCRKCAAKPPTALSRIIHTHRTHLRRMAGTPYSATQATKETIGCSQDFLKSWLESNFESGMEWGNLGQVWSIDHSVPCASFDLRRLEHRQACFHWSNLFPLFREDNVKKSARIFDDYVLEVQKRAECFVDKCRC